MQKYKLLYIVNMTPMYMFIITIRTVNCEQGAESKRVLQYTYHYYHEEAKVPVCYVMKAEVELDS